MKKTIIPAALLCAALACAALGAKAQAITPAVEQRAEILLRQMTLEEKIDYISGVKGFYIRALPRLGIPEIRMADGPQGVRNDTKSTLYPCGILSAATWNRELVNKLGVGLGQDCRARGVHFLLGPAVNIYRAPMCGRNFEYFGEDPYLASEVAVQYIRGLQAQGVVATIKHFAGNNQEAVRLSSSSDIDERTLHEIYLPTFEKAVRLANVGAVMSSYNLLNHVYTTENLHLNTDILRQQWGFRGIYMSDWGATHSVVGAANGGLDLEMPSGAFMNRKNLLPLVQSGVVPEKTIDEKVRRILQTLVAFGFLDREQKDASIPEQNDASDKVALDLAREGMVLLKNANNALPLKGKNLLVLGPNANKIPTGGGSGFVDPFSTVSVLEGLKTVGGKQISVGTLAAAEYATDLAAGDFFVSAGSKTKGLIARYFANKTLSGKAAREETETKVDYNWKQAAPFEGLPKDEFSVQWSGVYRPTKSGLVYLSMTGDDGYRIVFDGKEILSDWHNHAATTTEVGVDVEAGKEYPLRLEYYESVGDACATFAYNFFDLTDAATQAQLGKADAVVLCMGFNSGTEGEGAERTFALPAHQESLIEQLAGHHKNVIVVLNAGGGVDVSAWEDKVSAILLAWYPGQQGGTAVAEALMGKISPSGRLPITIEKSWNDNPTSRSYPVTISRQHDANQLPYAQIPPQKDGEENATFDINLFPYLRVPYTEGVFVGYRGYDRNGLEPRYPFGFGLSYSSFEYADFAAQKVDSKEGSKVVVSFSIKNVGKCDAAEVAQVYVSDLQASVPRPLKELKGYEKVFLKQGEAKKLSITLDNDAFAYYDVEAKKFVVEPGDFEIRVATSASEKDVKWRKVVKL